MSYVACGTVGLQPGRSTWRRLGHLGAFEFALFLMPGKELKKARQDTTAGSLSKTWLADYLLITGPGEACFGSGAQGRSRA